LKWGRTGDGAAAYLKQLRAIVRSPGFRRQFGRLEGERLQLVPPFTCRLLRTGLRGLNKAESIVSTHHRGGTKSRANENCAADRVDYDAGVAA
jgi:hypothetical protein